MNDLRKRLLIALASGTVEELARALQLLLMISTHQKNEAARPFTTSPASQLLCKFRANYSTVRDGRN